MDDIKRCIHGRTDKQDCKLCWYVSECCGAAVTIGGDTTHYHVCEQCGKACDIRKR